MQVGPKCASHRWEAASHLYVYALAMIIIALSSLRVVTSDPSVAIIGSGIGGSAAAYYIREVVGPGASITVFEKEERVGGRMEAMEVNGTVLEIGASILYTGNLHIKEAAEALGLQSRDPPHMGGTFGVWDGESLVYKSREFKPATLITMLWRYRWSLFRLLGVVRDALDRFMDIYDLQKSCQAYESPHDLWTALGLVNLTQISMRDYLLDQKVAAADSKLTMELVGAVNKVNYNQEGEDQPPFYGEDNGINALAGVVSLCPMVTGAVFSLSEGNEALARAMLNHSLAVVHTKTAVGSIEIVSGTEGSNGGGGGKPQYQVKKEGGIKGGRRGEAKAPSGGDGGDAEAVVEEDDDLLGVYDVVVIATPLVTTSLTLVAEEGGDAVPLQGPPREMATTISTFVEASLKQGAFGVPRTPSSIYLEIGLNDTHAVYKLFSSEPIEPSFLDTIFDSWRVIDRRDWAAYPRFHPPEEFTSFIVRPGHRIYYVNALESAVSAMEISAIAAKNVALLLGHSYGVCPRPGAASTEEEGRRKEEL